MSFEDSFREGVRIGNWVEEKALEEVTDNVKDSYVRAFGKPSAQFKPSENYKTTNGSDFQHPSVNELHFSEPEYGPRETMQRAESLRKAQAVVASHQAMIEEKRNERYMSSTNNSTFQAPTDEFRRREVTVGRSVMKTRSGVPIAPQNTRETLPADDEVPDEPVTVYSQRLAEGGVTCSAAISRNRFSKNTSFTNEVHDGRKFHAEGIDRPGNSVNPPQGCQQTGTASYLSVDALLRVCRESTAKRPETLPALEDCPSTVSVRFVKLVLRNVGTTLNVPQLHAVALHFEDADTAEFLAAIQPQSEGKDEAPSKAAGTITVEYSMKDGSLGSMDVPAPPRMRLELPDDEPMVRALLRKQKLVPAHVDRLTYN